VDTRRLDDAVARAFAVTGAGTAPWPDPHPDRNPPEEQYSRLSDPAKYRIVTARADAWVAAVTELELADAEEVTEPDAAWRTKPPVPLSRAVRLRPHRPGAASLLLGYDDALGGVPDTGLVVGLGDPAAQLTMIPDCGCDACDSGSEYLLDELDRIVRGAVSGDLVHVTTPSGSAFGTRDGWSAQGFPRRTDVGALLDEARAGRSPHPTVGGVPW
jgi:hypothetical protein